MSNRFSLISFNMFFTFSIIYFVYSPFTIAVYVSQYQSPYFSSLFHPNGSS